MCESGTSTSWTEPPPLDGHRPPSDAARESLFVEATSGLSECWLEPPTTEHGSDGRSRRRYRVFDRQAPAEGEPFHVAVFIEVQYGIWQPDLVACDAALRGRGITPAIYKRLVADTDGLLRSGSSSVAHQVYPWEHITEDGERIWRRLVDHGDAEFDHRQSRYLLLRR